MMPSCKKARSDLSVIYLQPRSSYRKQKISLPYLSCDSKNNSLTEHTYEFGEHSKGLFGKSASGGRIRFLH